MENIQIRKAKKEDAKEVAELMMLAMTEIVYQFIGTDDSEEGMRFLRDLVQQDNNQYSYQHIFIAETLGGDILGQICLYPGGQLEQLRKPVLEQIKSRYTIELQVANETQAGEIYIDTIAVSPLAQGKGVGKQLIEFVIDEFVNKRKEVLGLLVDSDNPNAKRLYEKMGFETKNGLTIFGKEMEHMQYSI